MEGTLIDHFRIFHAVSKEYELSASARSIYFALLGEFNAAHWVEELCISDRYMMELSGVKSLSTVHDARNLLKSLKFIDFRKGKNRKTVYRLSEERFTRKLDTQLAEHLPNTQRTLGENCGGVCYTRAHIKDGKDSKTLDITFTNAGACEHTGAGVECDAKSTEIGELTDSSSAASLCTGGTVASAPASALPLKSPINKEESDDIFEVWNFITNNAPLGGYQKYELKEKAERDYQLTIEAIKKAMDTKSSFVLKFEHFKKVYDELKNPNTKEGEKDEKKYSESNAQDNKPKYKLPKRTGNEPWLNWDEKEFDEQVRSDNPKRP